MNLMVMARTESQFQNTSDFYVVLFCIDARSCSEYPFFLFTSCLVMLGTRHAGRCSPTDAQEFVE